MKVTFKSYYNFEILSVLPEYIYIYTINGMRMHLIAL